MWWTTSSGSRRESSFTWVSERTAGTTSTWCPATARPFGRSRRGNFDVVKVVGHRREGRLALLHRVAGESDAALPLPHPAQRQGHARAALPGSEPGTHAYDVAPNLRYALDTYSSFGNPPSSGWFACPATRSIRTLVDNAGSGAVARLRTGPVEFFSIPAEDGAQDAGVADEAGGLRFHPEVSGAVPRLRRSREHRR